MRPHGGYGHRATLDPLGPRCVERPATRLGEVLEVRTQGCSDTKAELVSQAWRLAAVLAVFGEGYLYRRDPAGPLCVTFLAPFIHPSLCEKVPSADELAV
jgi:hypothetical protein